MNYTQKATAYLRQIENYDDGLIPIGLLEMLYTEFGQARLKHLNISKEVCINLLKDMTDDNRQVRGVYQRVPTI